MLEDHTHVSRWPVQLLKNTYWPRLLEEDWSFRKIHIISIDLSCCLTNTDLGDSRKVKIVQNDPQGFRGLVLLTNTHFGACRGVRYIQKDRSTSFSWTYLYVHEIIIIIIISLLLTNNDPDASRGRRIIKKKINTFLMDLVSRFGLAARR